MKVENRQKPSNLGKTGSLREQHNLRELWILILKLLLLKLAYAL